jgi:hypothetical protein
MRTLLVLSVLALAACSESSGDYCDTPGVCTLPDGMVPDAKADAKPDAGDASPDATPADAGGGG